VIIIYRIAFPFVALLASPYFFYRMLRRGGYGFKLRYRFGLFPRIKKKNPQCKRIWIQAVSVGELSSISKILDSLLQSEKTEIVLTGTTSTGLIMAAQKYHQRVLCHGPFPLDWWFFSCLAWSRIQPDLIITVDSELWPEHFHQASMHGIPALIINARLSDHTFQRIQGSHIAQKLLLPKGLEILTTSERQASRWAETGVAKEHIEIVGNLKIDSVPTVSSFQTSPRELRDQFGFKENSLVIAGISTWSGEEELLIETMEELRNQEIDARVLLIPRHAERRKKIISMLESKDANYHLRTHSAQAPENTLIYLADTTGELATLIQCADLALGGKTLPPNRGGQNPIEPISLGVPLVLGPNYQNFHQTCGDLLVHNALIAAKSADETKSCLIELAKSSEKREILRTRALEWIHSQGSPSEQTLKKINRILWSSSPSHSFS
jgi:3-deoxy-D-manno-octulosonic-acid transferase